MSKDFTIDLMLAAEMAAAREKAFAKLSEGLDNTQLKSVWGACACGHAGVQPAPRGPLMPKQLGGVMKMRCTSCGAERMPVFTGGRNALTQQWGATQEEVRQERLIRRVTGGAWGV